MMSETATSPSPISPVSVSPIPAAPSTKKPRDVRVDFFRGAAMLIIFVAHVPGNWLGDWIPARFGLSDAAHMFVFISGYAAAVAFGGTFARHGFLAGSARIAFRCLQLYAAHIGLFVVVALLCAYFADTMGGFDYARHLNIASFYAEPANVLVGLFSLQFVPTFFDILPLYMVVLAMVPAAMALARLHPFAVIAVSVVLWLAVQVEGFGLPAGYEEHALWGFNPFAWPL
ncbi:MAG: OpgC domain-containing protein, partial [Alphaproteobacteria bacterium]|nr:OpgC domain-containing protein [Alphaproteobacteria bacterium]